MLTRANRIPKKLFPLLKKNRLYTGEFFCVRVTFITTDKPKVVCIQSKKTEKKANKRNLMKRRVYEILRELLKSSENKVALQIFPQKNAFNAPYAILADDLLKIITINKLL